MAQSNGRVANILESITDGFFTLDHEWRFTYLNHQAEPLVQRTRGELLGKIIWEEFPKIVGSVFDEQYHKAVAEQIAVSFEAFYQPLDSWFEVRAYPSKNGLSIFFLVINERKRAEEALRRSDALFAAIINLSPVGMYLLDANLRLQQVNPSAQPAFGDIPNPIGRDFSEILHIQWSPPVAAEIMEHFRHTLTTGESYFAHGYTERRADRDKQEYYDWETHRITLPDGQHGVVCYFTDISAHVLAQYKIQESGERLLASEQTARVEAEAANRLKDEFLATLSHELRTPLTSIVGWAEMLASPKLHPLASQRAIETIRRNGQMQVQMIDDLLDVSRIITGKLRLSVQPVDLGAIIIAAVDGLRPAAEARQIRLQLQLDSPTGQISGDPDRLQQVAWNLVSNAIKFTPKGGRVLVRLAHVESHVEVTVSDTGSGIGSAFLPHVFDRFRQADATTTRAYGGLGLGLAIVRQLVELHGGSVRVESAGVGQGATFTVSLPIGRCAVRQTVRSACIRRQPPCLSSSVRHRLRVYVC